MFDALPSLLNDLIGDERNGLLTLARILFTLRTGLIAPKDVAAADVTSALAPTHAEILDLAARAYRREVRDDWAELEGQTSAVAMALTDRIYALRPLTHSRRHERVFLTDRSARSPANSIMLGIDDRVRRAWAPVTRPPAPGRGTMVILTDGSATVIAGW